MNKKLLYIVLGILLIAVSFSIGYLLKPTTEIVNQPQSNQLIKEVYPKCIASLCPVFSEVDVIPENGLPLHPETLIRIPLAMTQGAGKIVILSSDGEKVFDSGGQFNIGFYEAKDGNGFILKYSSPMDENLSRKDYKIKYIWKDGKFVETKK